MPTPSYIITCTANRLIATDVYELHFTKPEGLSFIAGQFVLFDVPLLENPTDIQTRAYSIASAPHEPDLLFVIKLTPNGRASNWIEKAVHAGTTVRMQGPFGRFVLNTTSPLDYFFIATSTGVAPFRSQILSAVHQGDRRRMDLIYGVRSEADLFWRDDFEQLAAHHPNLFVHLTMTQPSEEWRGLRGRVQTIVPSIAPDMSKKNLYACGSPIMTKEIKTIALSSWGMGKEQVHVEGYI